MSIKIGLVALAFAFGLSVPNFKTVSEFAQTHAHIAVQTGPIVLTLSAKEQSFALSADKACVHRTCPVLRVTLGSAALETAPDKPSRVQRLQAVSLQQVGLSTQPRDEAFSQEWGMGEAPATQSGQRQDPPITR